MKSAAGVVATILGTLWPEETEHDRAERLSAMHRACGVIAVVGTLQVALQPSAVTATLWAAWLVLQAGLAAWARRGGVARAQVAGTAANVLPSAALAALAWNVDGTFGAILFAALAAVPILDALFAVPDLGSPLLAGALAFALGQGQAEVHFADHAWTWGVALLLCTGLAAIQTHGRRVRREAELRAERERGEALEALARSRLARVDAEALQTLGVLADEVAHEVNSPLAAVKASLEFARGARLAGPEVDEALRDGLEGVERIRAIVSRLQALHRGWAARRYVRPLRAAAGEAAGIAGPWLAGRADVGLDVPEELAARAPWPLVVEMLASLVLQAAHGARPGAAPARVTIRGALEGARLTFVVLSSRPPSAIDVTAPGHGLTVCAEYARRIGGALTAGPAPGGGSRLTLELPVDDGETPTPRPEAVARPTSPPALRIVKG